MMNPGELWGAGIKRTIVSTMPRVPRRRMRWATVILLVVIGIGVAVRRTVHLVPIAELCRESFDGPSPGWSSRRLERPRLNMATKMLGTEDFLEK